MSKKVQLTLEEHKQLGTDLKKMDKRMLEIIIQLGNAVSQSSVEYRSAKQIEKLLSRLRSNLEDRMSSEIPSTKSLSDKDFFDVYYREAEKREVI